MAGEGRAADVHGPGLRARLDGIEARIAAACQAAGRARGEVSLIAVSKEQPDESVRVFHALGLRDFGENKVQALAARAERLADLEGVRWHLIGPVQTNKAKDIARMPIAMLHTIDRPELVVALAKGPDPPRALRRLSGGSLDREPQKAGVLPEAISALIDAVLALPCLELGGLMAIPRPLAEVGAAALGGSFEAMRALADTVSARIGRACILSMGMSDDYLLALAHGSTHVRVGTALFGPRGTLAGF